MKYGKKQGTKVGGQNDRRPAVRQTQRHKVGAGRDLPPESLREN